MGKPKIIKNEDGTTTVITDTAIVTAENITEVHTGPVVIEGDFTSFHEHD